MRIIYNKHFPFGAFFAMNIFGVIFVRSDKGQLNEVVKNHEYIHTLQQREMLFVGFMLWYVAEWLYRFSTKILFERKALKIGKLKETLGKLWIAAYSDIYFEREAYTNERDLDYANHRRPFAWWHMMKKE